MKCIEAWRVFLIFGANFFQPSRSNECEKLVSICCLNDVDQFICQCLDQITFLPSLNEQNHSHCNHMEGLVYENNKVRYLLVTFTGLKSFDKDQYKNLVTIDITFNKLKRLDPLYFPPSVTSINLTGNQIEFVDPDAFKGLKNLKTLILNKNHISKLDEETFLDISNLQVLQIRDNQITILSRKIFANLNKLHKLNIDENSLTTLPVLPRSVYEFTATSNYISSINRNTFDNARDLWYINLRNNSLTALDADIFKRNDLHIIDLADNNLIHLDCQIFKEQTHVSVIDLRGNSLHKFCSNWTDHLIRNQVSPFNYFNKNPWRCCHCSLRHLQKTLKSSSDSKKKFDIICDGKKKLSEVSLNDCPKEASSRFDSCLSMEASIDKQVSPNNHFKIDILIIACVIIIFVLVFGVVFVWYSRKRIVKKEYSESSNDESVKLTLQQDHDIQSGQINESAFDSAKGKFSLPDVTLSSTLVTSHSVESLKVTPPSYSKIQTTNDGVNFVPDVIPSPYNPNPYIIQNKDIYTPESFGSSVYSDVYPHRFKTTTKVRQNSSVTIAKIPL